MKNYIFGTGDFAKEVARRLDSFNINIDGFINIKDKNKELPKKVYKDIPVCYVDDFDVLEKESSNIILAKKPMFMGGGINYFRKNEFKNIYAVNEKMFFKKQNTIEELMKYFDKIDLRKPFLNYLEMNIVDQCNLNCKGCAHFSNICENKIVELERFENDLKLVAEKFNLYNFRLLGGEPLLHPQIDRIVEISRNILKKSQIIIVTNGLLIDKLSENVLRKISDCNVIISISLYEPTYKKMDKILNILKNHNINYLINDDFFREIDVIKTFHTRLSDERSIDGYNANKSCSGRFCRFLRDGKISKCYYPLLIDILNKKYGINFQVTEDDYIELDSIENGWDAIEKMNGDIPFCEYCRDYLDEFEWKSGNRNDELSSYILKKSK